MKDQEKSVFETFRQISPDFRGAPFWAWNSALNKDELVRQIHIMKEMGFGGFFMHSRIGMNTPYLSPEWFQCIQTCVSEAEKLDMKAWLYDEDRWPSGAAGGIVTGDLRYRQRYLACQETDGEIDSQTGDVWFILFRKGGSIQRYERISDPSHYKKSPGSSLCRFRVQLNESNSWFNNATGLDTLNPEAVHRFLEVTHEEYRKRFRDKFGTVIPGIFSDEANFRNIELDDGVPWTEKLPVKFQQKYGYDLLDFLPELFFDCGEKVSRVRWNFRDLLTYLFTDAFARQIGDWCEDNHLLMTGHILAEDTLAWQTRGTGAAMRFYEHMQMPGIDLLTEFWLNFNTVKQCVSTARQCGKLRRLTESYGCTGWDFPFMGHKALGDWQYALGINFRCQHLAWYSMEGEAKRDYPASIFFHSSWYPKYRVIEDYFARLSAVMTGGRETRDVLVIHPIESFWSLYFNGNTCSELQGMDCSFAGLTSHLLTENIDFDFGDEEMLTRMGVAEKTVFKVGEAEYRAILLPELKTIRSTTLQLLKTWADNGGTVVYLGQPPAYVDAHRSEEAARCYRAFESAELNFLEEKLLKCGRRLSVADSSGSQIAPVLGRLSEKDDSFSLFLCNTGISFSGSWNNCGRMVRDRNLAFSRVAVRAALPENGKVYELDAVSGTIFSVPFRYEDGCYVFETSFAPLESRLFLFSKECPATVSPRPAFQTERTAVRFPRENWSYTLNEQNALVLDHFSLRVNGKKELENAYFITADNHLRDILNVAHRGGVMVQPWARDKRPPSGKLDIELLYSFSCEELPQEECHLALERPDLYDRLLLNGAAFPLKGDGWWVDPVLQTISIPSGLLQKGRNILQLSGKYHEQLPGLETLYILGNFGVSDEVITKLPATLHAGDWCEQGLMEYSGDVRYCMETELSPLPGEHVFFRLSQWRGAAIGISVNDSPEQMICFPPFETEVTDLLRPGNNTFQIWIYGNRRNAFGPFFSDQKWQMIVGPDEFSKKSGVRQIVPCGMLMPPELLIRK